MARASTAALDRTIGCTSLNRSKITSKSVSNAAWALRTTTTAGTAMAMAMAMAIMITRQVITTITT